MQLSLRFPGTPAPPMGLWEQLDDESRADVVRKLARLIAQVAVPEPVEENDDD